MPSPSDRVRRPKFAGERTSCHWCDRCAFASVEHCQGPCEQSSSPGVRLHLTQLTERGSVGAGCHTHGGSRAAAVSPQGGRSATGTAPVPLEEDPTTRHTADVVKRTSTGVPGRRSRACLSSSSHPGSSRRGMSPAVSDQGHDHDRANRWDLRARRAGVCRMAHREPARICLSVADKLHASGELPQLAAASQA